MRRVVLLIAVVWLPLLTVAQTLVPLPPAGPVRPGDSWGVISGILKAEDGTPVVDTVLTAGIYRWDAVNNTPLCTSCVWGRTDDHGQFRIRVDPGRFHLRMMGTNSVRGYAPQFYGGAVVPRESGIIEVNAGQDRAIEFHLTLHAGSTIAGRIFWPASARSGAGGKSPLSL